MLNKIFSILLAAQLLGAPIALAKGKIQNEDVKTLTELQAGGGAISQLINDDKIYISANGLNKQLSTAITNGDIGGGGGSIGTPQNLLQKLNADAEKGATTSWSNSGGTFTATSSSPADGTYSFSFVSSASSQTVSSTSVAVPAGSYSKNGLLRFAYNTTNADYVLQVYDGTNVIASTTLGATTSYQYGSVTFQMPTSGNVQVRLVSASSGTIKFDDVYLGENFQIGSANIFSDWKRDDTILVPNNFGTVTNKEVWYRREGDHVRIRFIFQAGTTVASVGSFSLSSAYPIDTTKLTTQTSIMKLGYMHRLASTGSVTGSDNYMVIFYDGSDASKLYFGYTAASDTTFNKDNANTSFSTGRKGVGEIVYPVSGWTSQTVTASDTQALSWSGYISGCSGTNTQTGTNADWPSQTGCVMNDIVNNNFGTVTAASVGYGPTWTPKLAGTYEVCEEHSQSDNASGYQSRIVDGSGTVVSNGIFTTSSSSSVKHMSCGLYKTSAGVSVTFKLQTTCGGTCTFRHDPVDAQWSIKNVTQNLNMPNLVNQDQYVTVYESQTSGTNGGGFTSGSYVTRTLNTLNNPSSYSWVSLSSNQISLAPGTYWVEASAPAFEVNGHKAKLYNVTDAVDALLGTSAYAGANSTSAQTTSEISGVLTVSGGNKTFEIRHRCASTQNGNGLGNASSFGDAEKYTEVRIRKINP